MNAGGLFGRCSQEAQMTKRGQGDREEGDANKRYETEQVTAVGDTLGLSSSGLSEKPHETHL